MARKPAQCWLTCLVATGLALAGTGVGGTEIYRCVSDDGTVAFQETPCPEPAARNDAEDAVTDSGADDETQAAADDAMDFVNPFDEPEAPAAPPQPNLPAPPSKDRTECEKITRDAIDAIDREMQANTGAADEGREYLAELLALTAQLRACKVL